MEPSIKRKLSARNDDDPPTMADRPGKQRSQLNRRGSELRISDNGATKSMSSEIIKAADKRVADAETRSKDGKGKLMVTASGRKALGPSESCRLRDGRAHIK